MLLSKVLYIMKNDLMSKEEILSIWETGTEAQIRELEKTLFNNNLGYRVIDGCRDKNEIRRWKTHHHGIEIHKKKYHLDGSIWFLERYE